MNGRTAGKSGPHGCSKPPTSQSCFTCVFSILQLLMVNSIFEQLLKYKPPTVFGVAEYPRGMRCCLRVPLGLRGLWPAEISWMEGSFLHGQLEPSYILLHINHLDIDAHDFCPFL